MPREEIGLGENVGRIKRHLRCLESIAAAAASRHSLVNAFDGYAHSQATHKCVAAYYENLKQLEKPGMRHEGAVGSAFQELLKTCARQFDWKLVPEHLDESF